MKSRLFRSLASGAIAFSTTIGLNACAHQTQTQTSAVSGTSPLVLDAAAPLQSSAPYVAPVYATPEPPAKRVTLKMIVEHAAKPIPDRLLPDSQDPSGDWPLTSVILFYKKGFKSSGLQGDPELIIHHAWYKPLPSVQWIAAPKSLLEKSQFHLIEGGDESSESGGNLTALAFMEAPPGLWRLDAEIVARFFPDFSNSNAVYEGRARGLVELSTPQVEQLINPVGLHAAWIAALEAAPTPNGPWKRVPEPGQKGFPLHVKQPLNVYLRAVKLFPREPWPSTSADVNNSEALPAWEGRYWDSRFTPRFRSGAKTDVLHIEKSILDWENFERVAKGAGLVASSPSHLLTVTANAGANKVAQLFVEASTK